MENPTENPPVTRREDGAYVVDAPIPNGKTVDQRLTELAGGYTCETCASIAENFRPKPEIEADGHVCDCPHHSIERAAAIVLSRAMTFAPYGDWVVVKQDELSQFTSGKHGVPLHRPNRVADWTAYGRVLAIGPGPRDPETGVRVPITEVKVGDHVVYDWRPSHEQDVVNRICGPRTILLHENELLAIVEES